MTEICIKASAPYGVSVGRGAAKDAAASARKLFPRARKVAIVTDSNINAIHAGPVEESFAAAGFETHRFVFPAGERSKTLATYGSALDFLASAGIARSDFVAALGGGVAGDLAGFVAATYMRGVGFIQLPTSLLAMVDSSVGGKTGIDLAAGKNLAGAFHQPGAVFCDLGFLDTLPEEWRMDGMGEVLKYAVLGSPDIFAKLERAPRAPIGEVEIAACIGMKRDIVEKDERESSERKLLNLGHTFGHAIEKLSGFAGSHGRAVATGIAMASRVSAGRGMLSREDLSRIVNLVSAMGYDATSRHPAADIACAMRGDKKVSGDSVDLVLPLAIGKCAVCKTPLADLERIAESAL